MTKASLKLPPTPMRGINMSKRMDEIEYPVIASEKIDGVRVIFWNGRAFSKTRKLFPQKNLQHIAQLLHKDPTTLNGIECEVTIKGMTRAEVSGWCQKKAIEPTPSGLLLHAFGVVGMSIPYPLCSLPPQVQWADQWSMPNPTALDEFVRTVRAKGAEGVMLRGGDFSYKHGQATAKCQRLMKIKFREEMEAFCVGWEPLVKDALSSRDRGIGPQMGSLEFRHPEISETFFVGTGFSDAQRIAYAAGSFKLIGRVAEIEYDGIGTDGKPRAPLVFKRWKENTN